MTDVVDRGALVGVEVENHGITIAGMMNWKRGREYWRGRRRVPWGRSERIARSRLGVMIEGFVGLWRGRIRRRGGVLGAGVDRVRSILHALGLGQGEGVVGIVGPEHFTLVKSSMIIGAWSLLYNDLFLYYRVRKASFGSFYVCNNCISIFSNEPYSSDVAHFSILYQIHIIMSNCFVQLKFSYIQFRELQR